MKEFMTGRTGHPKLELLRRYRYAHRGFHDKPQVPENSLAAFRRAIERGFGAELDVHLTKDGKLVVFLYGDETPWEVVNVDNVGQRNQWLELSLQKKIPAR